MTRVPFHADKHITSATTTDLYVAATGGKLVVESYSMSTDTAGRVALIEEDDVEGSRIRDAQLGANGGTAGRICPSYAFEQTGNRLRVVTSAGGNIRVQVDGYEERP